MAHVEWIKYENATHSMCYVIIKIVQKNPRSWSHYNILQYLLQQKKAFRFNPHCLEIGKSFQFNLSNKKYYLVSACYLILLRVTLISTKRMFYFIFLELNGYVRAFFFTSLFSMKTYTSNFHSCWCNIIKSTHHVMFMWCYYYNKILLESQLQNFFEYHSE